MRLFVSFQEAQKSTKSYQDLVSASYLDTSFRHDYIFVPTPLDREAFRLRLYKALASSEPRIEVCRVLS
jgi:hypothetical protein